MTLKWYGIEVLAKIRGDLDDMLFEGAKVIQEAAQAKAPVGRTGRLKRGIYAASATRSNYQQVDKIDREAKPTKGAALIGSGIWYGRLVEYGTAKTRARPFMRSALDENKDKAVQKMADYLKKQMDG